jgi:hypothetical protein
VIQRLTLAERVEHFKLTFPKHPASWPWLVKERGHDVLYAVWVIGADYRNRTAFYGAYPNGFLKKLLALFPDVPAAHILHAFSGSLPKGAYTRIDLKPEVAPDHVGNIYDVAQLVGPRRFRLACADPPYSPVHAKKYGTPSVDRGRATRALASVVVPRGFLAWLDVTWPMHSSTLWRTVGRIYIRRSTNHQTRECTIFERLGRPGCANDSAPVICPPVVRPGRKPNTTVDGAIACAFGTPWLDHFTPPTGTGKGCAACDNWRGDEPAAQATRIA